MSTAAGALLVLAAVSVWNGWFDWSAIGHWLRAHGLIIVLASAGVTLLVVGALEPRRHHQRDRGQRAPLSWWAIAAGAALVLTTTWGATTWLLHQAAQAQDAAAARVDAVKTGLGIGAGTAGILALLVAVRRQWHQEITALDTNHDATERRVTDLYTKAVEQLGSDKAPVRLGGLYALERLAQDNPTQRQTIINVWCAYLRMPYTPPDDEPSDAALATETGKQALIEYREALQEKEVRLAAQLLLTEHILISSRDKRDRRPVYHFWPDINLDLSGAHLIDLDLSHCVLNGIVLARATFAGHTTFESALFTDKADFTQATFIGEADFAFATFTDRAHFRKASFLSEADFGATVFMRRADFRDAEFTHAADFLDVSFKDGADFLWATFSADQRPEVAVPDEVKPFWTPSRDTAP